MVEEDLNRLKNEEGGLSQERLPDELKRDIWEVLEAGEHFSPEKITWYEQEELWDNEQEDPWKVFLKGIDIVQRFDKLKLEALESADSDTHKWRQPGWEEIEPWTLHAEQKYEKYDYCLFNLVWWWQSGKWFLNDFFEYIDKYNCKDPDSVNFILSIYCNNFLEFRQFYHDRRIFEIDDMIREILDKNGGYEIDLNDIRCWLAHNGSYKEKNWKKWVYVKIDRGWQPHKEAYINPSFFDEALKLLNYYSYLDFDAVENWRYSKSQNYYTFKHKKRSDSNKRIYKMWNDSQFKQAFFKKVSDDKIYKKTRKSDEESKNMKALIESERLNVTWNTLWLVSDTNRLYVHNLLSIVSITICYLRLKNPNWGYKELKAQTIKELSNYIFTMQNVADAISSFFENIIDPIQVQFLRRYYVNIGNFSEDEKLQTIRNSDWKITTNRKTLSKSNQKCLDDIIKMYERINKKEVIEPGNEEANTENAEVVEREKLDRWFADCKTEYNKNMDKMRHIRNAFTHWNYLVIWNRIKMWDIDKEGEVTWGSTMDGRMKNNLTDINEGVFKITDLYGDLCDEFFENGLFMPKFSDK